MSTSYWQLTVMTACSLPGVLHNALFSCTCGDCWKSNRCLWNWCNSQSVMGGKNNNGTFVNSFITEKKWWCHWLWLWMWLRKQPFDTCFIISTHVHTTHPSNYIKMGDYKDFFFIKVRKGVSAWECLLSEWLSALPLSLSWNAFKKAKSIMLAVNKSYTRLTSV